MDELVVFSMDVVALYPSIMRDMAMEAIKSAINISEIVWENVDVKRLTRHVSIMCSRKEVCNANLGQCVSIPKSRTTLKSYIYPTDRAKETGGDS